MKISLISNKIIAVFLLVSLCYLNVISAKNYWECEDSNKKCKQSETCCSVNSNNTLFLSSDFKCFNGLDLICCGNEGVCEVDHVCNQKLQTCQKKSSWKWNINSYLPQEIDNLKVEFHNIFSLIKNYLDTEISEIHNDIVTRLESCHCRAVRNFTLGFICGLHVFNEAYEGTICAENFDGLLLELEDFIKFVRSIKYDDQFFENLKKAIDLLESLVKDYEQEKSDCKEVCSKIREILRRILNRFQDRNFMRRLSMHTIDNIGILRGKLEVAISNLKNRQIYDSGFNFGDLLRFWLLWDFEF